MPFCRSEKMLRTDKQSRWNEVDLHPEAEVDHGYRSLSLSLSRRFCGVRVFLHSSASPQQFHSCAQKCAQIRGYRLGKFSCETPPPSLFSAARNPHTRPRLAGRNSARADTLASWLEGANRCHIASHCLLEFDVDQTAGSGVPCRRYSTAGVRAWWNAWRQRADSRRLPSSPNARSSRAPARSPLPSCLPSPDRDLHLRGRVLLRPAQ